MPSNYDVKLTKTDGSTNEVRLTLDRTSESGGYAIQHVSPAPPNQASDAANYQQQSPDLGLVLDQDTFHRGFGQSLLERFDDAIINYEKAIEIEPNYADAWYNKAELLKHQGLEDEATNCFNKVKEIEGI